MIYQNYYRKYNQYHRYCWFRLQPVHDALNNGLIFMFMLAGSKCLLTPHYLQLNFVNIITFMLSVYSLIIITLLVLHLWVQFQLSQYAKHTINMMIQYSLYDRRNDLRNNVKLGSKGERHDLKQLLKWSKQIE